MKKVKRQVLTKGEEIANSITHGVGAGLSIAALTLLIVTSFQHGDAKDVTGAMIFGISMLLLYIMSTLCHAFAKKGGMYTYLDTNDFREVEDRIEKEGDKEATFIVDAMAYQVVKTIGSMVAALKSDVDAIILTGGLAYYKRFVDHISECFSKLITVAAYPGEMEMEALAAGGYRVLSGQEDVKVYE